MRYRAFDSFHQATQPLATTLNVANLIVKSDINPLANTRFRRLQSAMLETGIRFFQHYPKQGWGYEDVRFKGKSYPVDEENVFQKPFCNLMKFRRQGLKKSAPKVLFVAALSGHYATLSRETFAEFLPEHEVYVTDWRDARNVPHDQGRFGLYEYIDYVSEFIEFLGSETHVIALCQAGVPALISIATLSEQKSKILPKSLTLIASPMDISVNPGSVNKFSRYMTANAWKLYGMHRVPDRYLGAGRLVYPGILQLSGFMSMNIRSHLESFKQFAIDVYHENVEAAEKHTEFYDEYFATLDMTADFCVETLEHIFINNDLAKNQMNYKGKMVDCGAITDVPMLAMEGERDDMVRLGQCVAAVDFCENLPKSKKTKYVQAGVGHYGIFNGSKYRKEVAPRIKKFIASNS